MHCLKHSTQFSNIRTGNQSQTSHEPSTQIRHDVAVKVLEQHHIELLWSHDQLHARVINNLVVSFNVRISLRDVPEAIEKETVRKLHYVRLVARRHFLSLFRSRIFKSESSDAS